MDRAIAGEIPFEKLNEELLDEAARWHATPNGFELCTFLGLTREEYGMVMFQDVKSVQALILWKRACLEKHSSGHGDES